MKKLGIALAGGGARGAYQIGAWRALEEHGIFEKFSVFSGASVGSLNAVLYAMGDYDLAYNTWMSLDKKSLFNLEKHILRRVFKEKLNFINRGVYSTRRLKKLVETTIDFDLVKDKEIYIATTHLGDKKSTFIDLIRTNYKHFFKDDQQIEYINFNNFSTEDKVKTLLASCAIPVAFKPIELDGQTYYDGGILDNTPYQPLIDAGCDTIIVIDLFTFSPMRIKKVEGVKLYTCYPKRSLRGILDFNHKHIKRRFELGYKDMTKLLEKIKDELK